MRLLSSTYRSRIKRLTFIYNPLTFVPGSRCDIQSKTFLCVGRMSPIHKGFDLFIKAFALFAQHDKEWKLIFVGDGPESDRALEFSQKHNTIDSIMNTWNRLLKEKVS